MKAKIILIKAEKKKIGKYPIREFGESGEREAVIGIDRELGVDEEKDGLLYSIQYIQCVTPCSAHRGWRARIEEHERRLPVGCGCGCLGGRSCVSYHDNCHERRGEEHDIYSHGWSVRKRNSNLGISILKRPRTRYREEHCKGISTEMAGGLIQQVLRRKLQSQSTVPTLSLFTSRKSNEDARYAGMRTFALLGAGTSGFLGFATVASADEAEHGLAVPNYPWPHSGILSSYDHASFTNKFVRPATLCL
ncbi:hypothetical protein V6N13_083860 [Hibiscus sabdariffa]